MTAEVIWLSEDRATNPALVGTKAASLARAKRAGLPVLDGFAVPIAASTTAMASGADALRSRNSGFARATITGGAIDPGLSAEVTAAAASLGDRLVVRSSSVVESDGVWAGAFASYAELAPPEVESGIRGCWASVFNPDALARGDASGTSPEAIGMGVLVQPEIEPDFGGVATVDASGTVTIAAIEGAPAAIVSGWERGHLLIVTDKEATPEDTAEALGTERVAAVAELARATRTALGGDHIEWAEANGTLWLLQAQPAPPSPAPAAGELVLGPVLPDDPLLDDVARLLGRYPGPIGEQFVVSWAAGHSPLPDPALNPEAVEIGPLFARCQELRTRLAAERWPGSDRPAEHAAGLLRQLEGSDPASGLDALASAPPLDGATAAELLGGLDALAAALVAAGSIPGPGWLTHLLPEELVALVAGGGLDPGRRIGIGRWEPLLHRIATSRGTSRQGHAAAPGWGAGRIRFIRDETDAEQFAPREIVAAVYPLNNMAPLLWDAAGLITVGGSTGAHLFEVASWVGVPAVCNVDLEGATGMTLDQLQARSDLVGAVDGDRGLVSVLADGS